MGTFGTRERQANQQVKILVTWALPIGITQTPLYVCRGENAALPPSLPSQSKFKKSRRWERVPWGVIATRPGPSRWLAITCLHHEVWTREQLK